MLEAGRTDHGKVLRPGSSRETPRSHVKGPGDVRSQSRLLAVLFGVWAALAPALATAQTSEPAPPSAPDQGAIPSGAAGAVRVPAQAAPAPDANATVTPPKILHFEQAPYPPEAEKQGLEANVILRLDIDKDGKVTAVAVSEPAGHGFDEAATEAAKKFLFEPARRGTTPIPVRILYRYGFTLRPATPEEAKQARPVPTDSLRGKVLADDGDVPLAGATVEV